MYASLTMRKKDDIVQFEFEMYKLRALEAILGLLSRVHPFKLMDHKQAH
jgi:hypothetical protein